MINWDSWSLPKFQVGSISETRNGKKEPLRTRKKWFFNIETTLPLSYGESGSTNHKMTTISIEEPMKWPTLWIQVDQQAASDTLKTALSWKTSIATMTSLILGITAASKKREK